MEHTRAYINVLADLEPIDAQVSDIIYNRESPGLVYFPKDMIGAKLGVEKKDVEVCIDNLLRMGLIVRRQAGPSAVQDETWETTGPNPEVSDYSLTRFGFGFASAVIGPDGEVPTGDA